MVTVRETQRTASTTAGCFHENSRAILRDLRPGGDRFQVTWAMGSRTSSHCKKHPDVSGVPFKLAMTARCFHETKFGSTGGESNSSSFSVAVLFSLPGRPGPKFLEKESKPKTVEPELYLKSGEGSMAFQVEMRRY
jgi:hypothetical protein